MGRLRQPRRRRLGRLLWGLFGWTTTEPGPVEETGGYRMFVKDGQQVAGLGPSHWLTYFAVGDTDAAVTKATSLGASVVREAFDIPGVGRIAWLAGPHGEGFAVIKNVPQPA